MKGWSLVAVPVCVAGAIVAGCSSGDTPVPRVAISSALNGGANPTACRLGTISSIMSPPGSGVLGIGATMSSKGGLTVQDGSSWLGGTVKFTCSVIPNGDGSFKVSGRAELMAVTQGAAGTFNLVSGNFRPKENGKAPDVQNVFATLTSINGSLTQMNCIGTFDGHDESGARCATGMLDANDKVICSQNNSMDVKPPTADSKSAAVWGTVFCDAATDSGQNPPRTCKTAITFRFENCPSEAPPK
jgi:hypothetical protein